MSEGIWEILYLLAGLVLIIGGLKLFEKESSRDGGAWRKILGIILFLFGIGTFGGSLARISNNTSFLDIHTVIRAIWDGAAVPFWNWMMSWGDN